MKSKLKTVEIKINYWSCLEESHRHRTEKVAEACVKHATRTKKETNHWTPEKILPLVMMRIDGITYREIGLKFGVSVSRVREVFLKEQRRAAAEKYRINAAVLSN